MSKERYSDEFFDSWPPDEHFSPESLEAFDHNPAVHEAMISVNQLSRELCQEHGVSSIIQLPAGAQIEITEAGGKVNELVSLGFRHV